MEQKLSKGRKRLAIRELQLAPHMGWSYVEALQRKNEWLDYPTFIRGTKSFANYIETLLVAKHKEMV